MTTADITYMKRALTLARKGIGKTSPNPAVGCVIVNQGKIVGEGWHKRAGGHHAEIHALQMAGEFARGSDVYITLEPCSHSGKTPPCCDALIRAGVKRVIAGIGDPNPLVNGNGFKTLNEAGIQTFCGVLEDECRKINRSFIKHVSTGLPYVTFKCAMTLDGNIATATGESRWISGEQSRRHVHKMRSANDAIMVGVDTIIADNPQLNVRHVIGKDPLRIIVDTRLRTPETVTVLNQGAANGTLIATCEKSPEMHLRYTSQGAKIIVCEEHDGRVFMPGLLKELGKMGIQSVLLEGGSRLAGDMVKQSLIDEFVIFVAPKILGSDGFAPFALLGINNMEKAMKLCFGKTTHIGQDILIHAYPERSTCSQA
jgi:diaminohydroxyphosphoribosylaminopyrimidine deaminase / 5-amino-6-(5-phosphoribosylamino)uracil reductase